jgi:GntR family transcriptional regulator, transcriptional repressor for pyruvate dehydrogenase complex
MVAVVTVTERNQSSIGTDAERETLSRLRRLIEEDDYRDGDKLPPERQLAEELNVSRRVLRNAFAVLEAEGRVWRGVGQGTFVGRRTPRTIGDIANLANASNPVAVIEARLSLEPIVARFAAQRANSEHLSGLKRCAEETGRARSPATFDEWDERFHQTVVDASENGVFKAMFEIIRGVWAKVAWGDARTRSFTAEWQRTYARQHRVIAESIESRDLDRAENLMLEHWQTMRSNLTRDPVTKGGRGA